MASNRDSTFDIFRALCALEIIAFWHIFFYLPDEYSLTGIHLEIGKYLTMIALSGFSFMSGYMLKKYEFNTWGDVWIFFKKRFKRFYILLFLSCFSLYAVGLIMHHPWFTDTKQFVFTLVGLNVFFPPLATTLWFFSMMIFFYLITPLVIAPRKVSIRVLFSVLILGVLLLLNRIEHADSNLLYYYPFYILGLMMPYNVVEWVKRHSMIVLPSSLLCLFGVFACTQVAGNQSINGGGYLIMTFGIICLISISSVAAKSGILSKFFYLVSYSSMVAYLFHRQIFYVICAVLGDDQNKLSLFMAFCVAVPIVFIVSYFIQKIYDRVFFKRATH